MLSILLHNPDFRLVTQRFVVTVVGEDRDCPSLFFDS